MATCKKCVFNMIACISLQEIEIIIYQCPICMTVEVETQSKK